MHLLVIEEAEGNLYFFYFLKGFEKFFFLRKQIKFLKPFSYILNINIRIFQKNGSHILDIPWSASKDFVDY